MRADDFLNKVESKSNGNISEQKISSSNNKNSAREILINVAAPDEQEIAEDEIAVTVINQDGSEEEFDEFDRDIVDEWFD